MTSDDTSDFARLLASAKHEVIQQAWSAWMDTPLVIFQSQSLQPLWAALERLNAVRAERTAWEKEAE